MEPASLGDFTFESKVCAANVPETGLRVYGVDRTDGLTPDAKYASKDLSRYKILRPGMFAYNPMRLNIGSIAACTDKHAVGLVSPDYVVFGCKPDVLDSAFLGYAIKGPEWRQWTTAAGVGSVRIRIYFRELAKMPITVPPLPEQKAIVSVLGALDGKIELNQRMNATLEATASALFQSWFADFVPVRAKHNGHPPAGLDSATAALFPDSFQDSTLGQIPKGWEIKTADEVSKVGIGKTPPRKEHHWFSENPAHVPWMSIRDLGNAGAFISHTAEFLTPEAVEKFRVKRIPDRTVVLSFKMTMGRVAITDGEMSSNEAIAHFRLNPDTTFGPEYLYCYLKGFGYDQLGSTSSIAAAINSDMVRRMHILIPPKGIAEAFERTVKPLFMQMRNIQKECRTLATLRDTLLPKLLTGEVMVAKN